MLQTVAWPLSVNASWLWVVRQVRHAVLTNMETRILNPIPKIIYLSERMFSSETETLNAARAAIIVVISVYMSEMVKWFTQAEERFLNQN